MSLALQPPSCPALWSRAREMTADDRENHRNTTIPAMQKAVAEVGAAGMSMTQVGIPLRCFVTSNAAFPIVVNPHWEQVGSDFISKPEKSLTRLDYSTYVRRPAQIRATFEDENGTRHEINLEGMDARVFMHMQSLVDGKPIFPRPKSVAVA